MSAATLTGLSQIVEIHATDKRERMGKAIDAMPSLCAEERKVVASCISSGDDIALERHVMKYREQLCRNLIH